MEAVGLFENPVALARWIVAGPEQARLLTEFESQFMKEEYFETVQQHEQGWVLLHKNFYKEACKHVV